jgi:hypothetical protein
MMLSATMVFFVSVSVNVFGAIMFLTRKTDYQMQMQELREARRAQCNPTKEGVSTSESLRP